MLKQAVGESAGGGAHVQANLARHADAEGGQRRLQLQPAAADVAHCASQQAQRGAGPHQRARLFGFLFFDQNLSRQDQCLRLLASFRQAAFHQQFVQPYFQTQFLTARGPQLRTREKLIKARLGMLALAGELQNMWLACQGWGSAGATRKADVFV